MVEPDEEPAAPTHPPSTDTHCPYCALQCGMTLTLRGSSVEVSARDFPTNRGALCRKGWAAAELLEAPDRLRSPLLRTHKGGRLLPVTWNQAVEFVGAEIQRLQAQYGADSVGVFGGGGLTNETAYMLGKFARTVLCTRYIDYNGRFCMASAAVAGQLAFGIDRGLPFPLEDLPAADVVLMAGANPAETMPPLMQYFDQQRALGGKLIVVDPRRTPTAEYAALHLQLTPGTDVALANGLLHVIIRDGLIDESFIERRTTGFAEVKRTVAQYWPDRVERICGVAAAQILQAAQIIGRAKSLCILSARGVEQQSQGVDGVLALINIALATGQVGKPHAGYGCLTGQGNGQGGREHGQKAGQLPGYRDTNNPEHRAFVAAQWGVSAEELPEAGPSACELFDAIGQTGGPRALLIMGSNLVVSAPNASRVEAQLRSLDLLVVADAFLSETAQIADVVLPVCHWAEHSGTLTNLEGRLLQRRKLLEPPDGVATDLDWLQRIAQSLGRAQFVSADPEQVFQELARVSSGGVADYAGFSHERLRQGEQLFWPCPTAEHPGTPRLFADTFPTRDGRAKFHAVNPLDRVEQVSEEFPFYLITGRLLAHYQTGAQTHRVASLEQAEPEPFAQMHPQLAAIHQLADGDWVALSTRRGRAVLRVKLSSSLRLDTVFVPFHWSGSARANSLTSSALDPRSKIPEFKLSAVHMERMSVQPTDSTEQ